MTESVVIRLLVRGMIVLLLAALLAYPADYAVWRVRLAAGGGMGTVQVTKFTVAELKGGKESYYIDGVTTVDCSRSLFPEAGSGPCWWVSRHAEVIDRY